MLWIAFILLMGAGCAAYVGATQLDRSKQRDKCSIEAFTERRNGVACRCCWWSLGWDLPCKGAGLTAPRQLHRRSPMPHRRRKTAAVVM